MRLSKARPSISGSTAGLGPRGGLLARREAVAAEQVVHERAERGVVVAQGAVAPLERVGANSPPFRKGTRPKARAVAARRAGGVLSVPKNSGRSTRASKRPPAAMHASKRRARKARSPSSHPLASRNARKRSRVAHSSARSARARASSTPSAASARRATVRSRPA
jgi:hypothetical protein